MYCFYFIQHIYVGKYPPCRLTVSLAGRMLKQISSLGCMCVLIILFCVLPPHPHPHIPLILTRTFLSSSPTHSSHPHPHISLILTHTYTTVVSFVLSLWCKLCVYSTVVRSSDVTVCLSTIPNPHPHRTFH